MEKKKDKRGGKSKTEEGGKQINNGRHQEATRKEGRTRRVSCSLNWKKRGGMKKIPGG